MARPILATDFKDDIMQETMNGKRRYRMVNNTDGTVSFEDATDYEQVGNTFGAGQINATNEAVNQSVDSNKLVKELSTISAITKEGYVPDALAVKELNKSLVAEDNLKFRFSTDGEGNYGYLGADDSFIPFKKNVTIIPLATTSDSSFSINVANFYDGDLSELTINNFLCEMKSITSSSSAFLQKGQTPNSYATGSLTKSYDNTTGVFTASFSNAMSTGKMSKGLAGDNESFATWTGGAVATSVGNFIPYLVV